MSGERQRNDWFAVGAYALLAATSQMLWLTFAPITTESAAHFGVSEDTVGWLAEIFPLLYVLLAVPAGILLDRWMRQTLVAAAALMLAGALLRLGSDSIDVVFAGQVLIAVAQPAVLAAVTKLAAEYVEPGSRTMAISVGSAGTFLGLVTALVLGATIGAESELRPLLTVNVIVAAIAFAWAVVALRGPAPQESSETVSVGFRELRAIYTDPVLSRLGGMIFLGMGVFNGLATWLEVLLRPAGVSSSTVSWMLVVMAIAGIFGAIFLAPRVSARGGERAFIEVAALIGTGAFIVLAATSVVGINFAVLAVLGFVLLGAQPVLLEISERRAGHTAASAAGALFLAGNLGGIVLAVLVQSVNSHAAAAFLILGAAMLLLAPIARSLPDGFARPR
jgi:predicted MFS family arabinose efflux permease